MDYQVLLETIYGEVRGMGLRGTAASYIPELAKVDADKFGISLVTTEGQSFSVGDAGERFSIQSISKAFTLALAFAREGERLWRRVGVEPSGNPFNSLALLEHENGKPRNPFINAGALVITDVLRSYGDDPLGGILGFVRGLAGSETIDSNVAVALSELRTSDRNMAIVHLMKSFGNIDSAVDDLVETYCGQCAIEMSCEELARAFLLFANHGKHPATGERVLTVSQTQRINAVMQTCGLYDEAGEFAFKVGLPGKSGVGGGIAAVLPGRFSVAVWGPGLNAKGNSVFGMKALELLTTGLGYSVF